MVTHVAVFQPKPDVSEEQILAVLDMARSLIGKIPGLVNVTAGKEIRQRSPEYTWGFTMQLESKEALDGYYPHPAHREFATRLKGISERILDFDVAEE